jgi:hypothetical protein
MAPKGVEKLGKKELAAVAAAEETRQREEEKEKAKEMEKSLREYKELNENWVKFWKFHKTRMHAMQSRLEHMGVWDFTPIQVPTTSSSSTGLTSTTLSLLPQSGGSIDSSSIASSSAGDFKGGFGGFGGFGGKGGNGWSSGGPSWNPKGKGKGTGNGKGYGADWESWNW